MVFLPPRAVMRAAWSLHRGIYRISRGRLGLKRPRPGREGALRLTTTGRRSGRPRAVIVAYFDDGPNQVTLAMNGWGEGDPAWWLNLQANPDATTEVGGRLQLVRARAAEGAEHDRLWNRWRTFGTDLDAYAATRTTPTAVVVLEPRPT